MTWSVSGLGLLGVVVSAQVALADQHCNVPMADWQPREALQQKLAAEGWKVLRIKTDDGCYKVHAVDDQGRRLDAKVDPATLAILPGRGEGHHGREGEEHGRHGSPER